MIEEKMIDYKYKLVSNKRYEITTTHNDEEIKFHVVVATDESQLDELVEFHLNGLSRTVSYTPSYKDLRRNEYPSIGDQLDALYHAGIFPQEIADKIAVVKTKYPKE